MKIGSLIVDGEEKDINIPKVNIEYLEEKDFVNPKKILVLKGAGENGTNVEIFCEGLPGESKDRILLKDRTTDKLYELYMANGYFLSREVDE